MSVLPHTCNCPYCPGNLAVEVSRRVRARDLTIEVAQFVKDLQAQGPDNTPPTKNEPIRKFVEDQQTARERADDLVGRLE